MLGARAEPIKSIRLSNQSYSSVQPKPSLRYQNTCASEAEDLGAQKWTMGRLVQI